MASSDNFPPVEAVLAEQPEPEGLQYLQMLSYIFEHPQWGMTLLLGTVCQFIPLIGNILLIGYQFEIVEQLHRGRKPYPEFDFDKFVPYLFRGIWPVLVNLVVGLVLLPVVLLGIGAVALVLRAMDFEPDSEAAVLLLMGPLMCGSMVFGVLLSLLLIPMSLRAGLSQDFSSAFHFGFVRDFLGKVWLEMILGGMFLVLAYLLLLPLGIALCFVGIYPAVTVFLMAQAHLYFQLYSLYLRRGGQPIPLKPAS